jgi:hypothetical protein
MSAALVLLSLIALAAALTLLYRAMKDAVK